MKTRRFKSPFLSLLAIGFSFLLVNTSSANLENIKSGLSSSDSKILSATLDTCSTKGKEILPQLRKWAVSDDPRLKANARTALGKITGQWASQNDLLWQTNFDQAVELAKKENKPIMLLHLFGRLDEEFC